MDRDHFDFENENEISQRDADSAWLILGALFILFIAVTVAAVVLLLKSAFL